MNANAEEFGPFMERWNWDNGQVMYVFHCPGCDSSHAYWTAGGEDYTGPIWQFDGNADAPSFAPSLLNSRPVDGGKRICHLFVRAGQIEYCPDCTHALAGQTVPMQPFLQICKEKTP